MLTAVIFLLSWVYWIVMACSSQMSISADAIGYERLGQMIHHQGWVAYFQNGPNREPLFPFMVSCAMQLADLWHCDYQLIQKVFHLMMLGITQWMLYHLLCHLKIRRAIVLSVIAYFAFSPAVNNAAMSLFSEIAAFPQILLAIILITRLWAMPKEAAISQYLLYGASLGLACLAIVAVKGMFEVMCVVFMAPFCVRAVWLWFKGQRRMAIGLLSVFVCVMGTVYIPLHFYKKLNERYNGQHVYTDRAGYAFYGNAQRRAMPLTLERFATALAYVPGEGVCIGIFGAQKCDFWSFRESDVFGMSKGQRMLTEGKSYKEMNAYFITEAFQSIKDHPVQFTLLSVLEGFKMFFWESTAIGFVQYAPLMKAIYANGLFKNGIRLALAFLTLWSMVMCAGFLWTSFRNRISDPNVIVMAWVAWFLFLFIGVYSPFYILTRYALPIVSLFCIVIAFSLDRLFKK